MCNEWGKRKKGNLLIVFSFFVGGGGAPKGHMAKGSRSFSHAKAAFQKRKERSGRFCFAFAEKTFVRVPFCFSAWYLLPRVIFLVTVAS